MKKPHNLNISPKHQRQLTKAANRQSNEFMKKLMIPAMDRFSDDEIESFPHLFKREAGSFAHLDLDDLIEEFRTPDNEVDWLAIQPNVALFTNPLVEADFDPTRVIPGQHSGYTPPGERISNAGWCVFTFEYDGGTSEDLEMQLDWFAGKPEQSPFAAVHRALSEFADYRGYSAVFSGNKSLHIHIAFDLRHLSKTFKAGPNSFARTLWDGDVPDDLIGSLHPVIWSRLAEIINKTLGCNVEFDPRLKSYVQKRRMPWGVRTLIKNSDLHGFQAGDQIEQIVVQERIIGKSGYATNPKTLINAADAKVIIDVSRTAKKKPSRRAIVTNSSSAILDTISDYLSGEGWAEYPKPVRLEFDGTYNILVFRNHADDLHASTIVRGDYRKLLWCGRHQAPDDLFLPNNMSLDETLDLLFPENHNLIPVVPDLRLGARLHPIRNFEATVDSKNKARLTVPVILKNAATHPGATLVQAPEGTGKTHALMNAAMERRWEHEAHRYQSARSNGNEPTVFRGFTAIACKSYRQTDEKADEWERADNGPTAVVRLTSFTKHYQNVLKANPGTDEIRRKTAGEKGYPSLLHAVQAMQPAIFQQICTARNLTWANADGEVQFIPDACVVMVHDVLKNWSSSYYSKAFMHPEFPDDLDPTEIERCAKEMNIHHAIYDEIDWTDLVFIEPAWKVQIARRIAKQCRADSGNPWDEAHLSARVLAYQKVMSTENRSGLGFDKCDQIVRTKFRKKKDRYSVDAKRYRFGKGTEDKNIYAGTDGEKYYCKKRRWFHSLGCPVIILTTEDLPRLLVSSFNGPSNEKSPLCPDHIRIVNLSNNQHLFQEIVPVVFDERSRMPGQRKDGNKPTVIDLATELLEGPIDFVISNGLKKIDETHRGTVASHKDARGRNDLQGKAIATLVTYPGIDEYKQLCILGAAFDICDPVAVAYRDMIFQDLGRNLGFRSDHQQPTAGHFLFIKSALFNDLMKLRSADIDGSSFDRYRFRLIKF